MNAHEAYVALNMMEGIGPVSVKALVEALGSPEAILEADRSTLMKTPGIGPGLADKILYQRNQIDPGNEIRRAAEMGAALITPADRNTAGAGPLRPTIGFVRLGRVSAKDRHALAIVDSPPQPLWQGNSSGFPRNWRVWLDVAAGWHAG